MELGDIFFLSIIIIFLIILYGIMAQNWKLGLISNRYFELEKNGMEKDYIRSINIYEKDKEKLIFKDIFIILFFISIVLLFITKTIFFAAVVSESMTPTINKYDMVLLQNIDHRYAVGDIIMFNRPDTSLPVTHRIRSIDEDGIIKTAGDAAGQIDWWQLKKEDIVGKAFIILEKPITIKNFGRYFIAENKNQRFGPFDYGTYFLFIEVIKLYGYAIAAICIFAYIFLEMKKYKKKI